MSWRIRPGRRPPTDRRRQHLLSTLSPFRRASLILLIMAALVSVPTAAWSYWTSSGSGTGQVQTGMLNAPTKLTAIQTIGSSTIALTWVGSTLSTGTPAQGYYVTRIRTTDNSATNACGTSPTKLTATADVSCADSGVPEGTFQYVVTAVYQSWTTDSAPSTAVTVRTATKLVFTTDPSPTATAGTALVTQPAVSVQDASGNTITNDTSWVNLTLTTPAGDGLSCAANTQAVTSGKAVFAGCQIDKAGTYTLTATDGSLTPAISRNVIVTAGVARKLAFSQQPSDSVVGESISPPPTVQILDAFGNLTSGTASVTIAIRANPALGTLSGPATVSAVNGIATFSGLSIDRAGAGYTLAATGAGVTPAISGSFTLTMAARAPVKLGTAGTFAILSKSGVTDVPSSSIQGNVGTSPITGAAITGLECSEVNGKIYTVDAAGPLPCRVEDAARLTTAVADMEAAYTDAAGRTSPDFTEKGAGEIGGLALTPGLYKWGTGVTISTDVTLNGGPNDVWIFQIAGTLTEASAKKVTLTGGAQVKNVFWQVAGAVTIGTTAQFEGTILAKTYIAMQTGATIKGGLLAQTAVTLDHSTVTNVH